MPVSNDLPDRFNHINTAFVGSGQKYHSLVMIKDRLLGEEQRSSMGSVGNHVALLPASKNGFIRHKRSRSHGGWSWNRNNRCWQKAPQLWSAFSPSTVTVQVPLGNKTEIYTDHEVHAVCHSAKAPRFQYLFRLLQPFIYYQRLI